MGKTTTVRSLRNLELFQKSKFISTQTGFARVVKNITIMDIANIDEWVKENELLIIGSFLKNTVTESFISNICKKNIAGIITKDKFASYLTENMLSICKSHDIPVIIIPNEFTWSELMNPVQQLIIRNQSNRLLEMERFQEALIKHLVHEEATNYICPSIYEVTGLTIAITDQNLHYLDTSPKFDWINSSINLIPSTISTTMLLGYDSEGKPVTGFSYKNTFDGKNYKLFFYPIYKEAKVCSYIILKTDPDVMHLSSSTLSKIKSVASIYKLKQYYYSEFHKSNLRFRNIVFENLINSTKETLDKKKYSIALGIDLEDTYRIAAIRVNAISSIDSLYLQDDLITFENLLHENILSAFGTITFSRKDYWLFLIPDTPDYKNIVLPQLSELLNQFFQQRNVRIGVSRLHSLDYLQISYNEALQSLSFLENNATQISIQYYEELGIIKLLTDDYGKINQVFIDEMLSQFIQPLMTHDEETGSELYKTLQVYFNNNFSQKKTSNLLFIHKNTLRARFKRVEEILQISLDENNAVLNLQLAFKINNAINLYVH